MTKQEEKVIEDAPFEIPPFDEKEFIKKELISFKTTLVLFVFSLAIAGASFLLWRNVPQIKFFFHLVIALGVAFALLRFILKAVRVDVSQWKRKEWFGTYALYFFFWLGFFLLLVNPPLTDASGPLIQVELSPRVQGPGEPVVFGAYIADNVGVDENSILFCIAQINGTIPARFADLPSATQASCRVTWQREDNSPYWSYTFQSNVEGTYAYYVEAQDKSGAANEPSVGSFRAAGNFTIGNAFTTISTPRDNSFRNEDDNLRVQVDSRLDLISVQYQIDNQTETYAFDKDSNNKFVPWYTNPHYPGWHRDAQNVTIVAQEQPRFLHGGYEVKGQVVRYASAHKTLTVSSEYQGLNSGSEPDYNVRQYRHPGGSPGFELVALLAAIVGAALVWRRKRHG